MLDVIQDYEFSSVANQLAIQVLDQIKSVFDASDLEQLKSFVKDNLKSDDKVYMEFSSGRHTTKSHLAAIIKMALVLKKMTVENGLLAIQNNKPQSEEEKKHFQDQLDQINDKEWTHFCNSRLKKFETKWTKKLEDYTQEDHDAVNGGSPSKKSNEDEEEDEKSWENTDDSEGGAADSALGGKDQFKSSNYTKKGPPTGRRSKARYEYQQSQEEKDEQEELIGDMLNQIGKRGAIGGGNSSSNINNFNKRAKIAQKRPTRDEIEGVYFDNQFWKVDIATASIEDLLKEEGF